MKKITVQPLSIDDLPKPEEHEPTLEFHTRLTLSNYQRLKEVAKEKGYPRNTLLNMALKAFLK